jgi:hypothetical protein
VAVEGREPTGKRGAGGGGEGVAVIGGVRVGADEDVVGARANVGGDEAGAALETTGGNYGRACSNVCESASDLRTVAPRMGEVLAVDVVIRSVTTVLYQTLEAGF